MEFLDLGEDVFAFRRGATHAMALNMGARVREVSLPGTVVRSTHARSHPSGTQVNDVTLGPGEGLLVER